MRRKSTILSVTLFFVLALVLLCGCLASCGGGKTYYRVKNGTYDYEDYIKIDGDTWEDADGASGTVKKSGDTVTLYVDVFGEQEVYLEGTLQKGVLTYREFGTTYTYALKGKAPEGAQEPAGNGGTTGGDQTDGGTRQEEKKKYTVTYAANGGVFDGGATTRTETAEENARLTAPASPVREGYTFAGWTKSSGGGDPWNFASDSVTGETKLWAQWKQKSATIFSVDGAKIGDDRSIFMWVDHTTDSVSLAGKVVCSDDSTWRMYYDKMGQTEIPTKIAASMTGVLAPGENTFWLVVTSQDGTQVNTYPLTVYRSFAVEISYRHNDRTVHTDTVYTGVEYAVTYTPSLRGYTFSHWKYNGSAAPATLIPWRDITLNASATANRYTVTYDVNGGDALSETTSTVTYDASWRAPVPKRTGYAFLGWAVRYEDTLLTTSGGSGLDEWGYASDTTLYAQWKANNYTLTVVTTDGGTLTGAQTGEYTYDSTVTLSAKVAGDYHFLGWFDGDGKKLSGNLTYRYPMRLENTVTAKFEKHDWSLTGTTATCTAAGMETYECTQCHITKQEETAAYDHDWSLTGTTAATCTTAGTNHYECTRCHETKQDEATEALGHDWSLTGTTVTCTAAGTETYECTQCHITKQKEAAAYDHNWSLTSTTATCTAAGTGTYECTRCHVTKQGAMAPLGHVGAHNENCTRCGALIQAYIRCNKDNTPNASGKYILFGEYPQTIKDDDVTITGTTDSRGYYLGSDGCYYAKVTATLRKSGYKFSTGTTVTSGTVYYFKVEPIRWRILTEGNGKAFLLCDSIIANQRYYEGDDNKTRTIDGKTVYANNYMYSSIRKWLNEEFYKTAFSALQQELILVATVSNSARSTNPSRGTLQINNGNNYYACANTSDKIFLLSVQEVTDSAYDFSSDYDNDDTAREMQTSDYARAIGAYTYTDDSYYGNGVWLLRSPSYKYKGCAYDVNSRGSTSYAADVNVSIYGVVPALWISL